MSSFNNDIDMASDAGSDANGTIGSRYSGSPSPANSDVDFSEEAIERRLNDFLDNLNHPTAASSERSISPVSVGNVARRYPTAEQIDFMEYINNSDEEYENDSDSDDDESMASNVSVAGSPPGSLPDRDVVECLRPAFQVSRDELARVELLVVNASGMVTYEAPCQRISWDKEKNTINWDLKALCLCGELNCEMKFGKDEESSGWFSRVFEDDSEETKKRVKEDERKYVENQESMKRELIKRLEKQSRVISEVDMEVDEEPEEVQERIDPMTLKTLPPIQKGPEAPLPLTLWGGIPIHRMTKVMLIKSQAELNRVMKGLERRSNFEWTFAQTLGGSTGAVRYPGGLVDILSNDAEKTDAKIAHCQLLMNKVDRNLQLKK